MGFGLRLYCFLLSVLVLLCAICARNTISLPGPDGVIMVDVGGGRDRDGRRCLKVETDDYGDPSANHGHDPKTKIVGAGGGRRGRDTP